MVPEAVHASGGAPPLLYFLLYGVDTSVSKQLASQVAWCTLCWRCAGTGTGRWCRVVLGVKLFGGSLCSLQRRLGAAADTIIVVTCAGITFLNPGIGIG